jgi:hypothetical protein
MVNRNLPALGAAEIFAEASVKNGFFCPGFDLRPTA